VLTPYPLEPPPALPDLDGPWAGPDAREGRRVAIGEATREVAFADGVTLVGCSASGGSAERRTVALEEPLFLWEMTGGEALTCRFGVEWPRRPMHLERAADGGRLWVALEGDPLELLVACWGGTLTAAEDDGRLRIAATGRARLRVAVLVARDEADRERTFRQLARKGVPGLAAQRAQHDRQREALGLLLEQPDAAQAAACRDAVAAADRGLREGRDGARRLRAPLDEGETLLAGGIREPVRDHLRAPFDRPEDLLLLARYAAWAGDDDFLRRQWPRVDRALRSDAPDPAWATAAAALRPVAEALGDPAERLEVLARSARAPRLPDGSALVQALRDPWGVEPVALDNAVTLAPRLPGGWREMALRRLRIARTTLDVRVRRRPAGLAVQLVVTHGPRLLVRLAPRLDFAPSGVLVAGESLAGGEVRFEVEGEVGVEFVR
jgi:hypothetical protein